MQSKWCSDMGDFTQRQQKYAAAGENCDFVITVNFYLVQRTFWNVLCIFFGFVSTQTFNLDAIKFFLQNWKIFRKTGFNPIFQIFLFNLKKNKKSECLQTKIICTKKFKEFFGQGKNWKRLQNGNFHQLQQIFAVAGWNHPYLSSQKFFSFLFV